MTDQFSYNLCGHVCRAVGTPEDPWLSASDVSFLLGLKEHRASLYSVPPKLIGRAPMKGKDGRTKAINTINLDGVEWAIVRRNKAPEEFKAWAVARKAGRSGGGAFAAPVVAPPPAIVAPVPPATPPPTAIAKVEPQVVAPLEPVATLDWFNSKIDVFILGGHLWMSGADAAIALGLRQAADLTRSLPDDMKVKHVVRTLGGPQEITLINREGIVWSTVKARPQDPERRERILEFQRWAIRQIDSILAGKPVEPPTGKAAPVELPTAPSGGSMALALKAAYEHEVQLAEQAQKLAVVETTVASTQQQQAKLAQRMAEMERRAMLDRAATAARGELRNAIERYGQATYPDDKEKCSECIRSMKHAVKADAHHVAWEDLVYDHCVKWLQNYATIIGHALFRVALAKAKELAVEQLELPKSAA